MKIRKDLASVAEYLERLNTYADVFDKNNHEIWSHLKNKEDYRNIYSLEHETKRVFEKIYENGRDCAFSMSEKLRSFNYADICPTLTVFITSFEDGWVYQVDMCRELVAEATVKWEALGKSNWAIGQMILLFEDQLKLLDATKKTLQLLKQTRLYKIENNEAPVEKENMNITVSGLGGNSRVNINSNDSSVNIDKSSTKEMFSQIEDAFNSSGIDESERDKILAEFKGSRYDSNLYNGITN